MKEFARNVVSSVVAHWTSLLICAFLAVDAGAHYASSNQTGGNLTCDSLTIGTGTATIHLRAKGPEASIVVLNGNVQAGLEVSGNSAMLWTWDGKTKEHNSSIAVNDGHAELKMLDRDSEPVHMRAKDFRPGRRIGDAGPIGKPE